MDNLTVFKHGKFGSVRTMYIDMVAWFVAIDIGNILELSDTRKSVLLLDEDDRNSIPVIDSLGRKQNTNIVNESGLYQLIFQSRKPKAKEFTRWVTSEVLPSIRKTGSYSVNQNDYANDKFLESMANSHRMIACCLTDMGTLIKKFDERLTNIESAVSSGNSSYRSCNLYVQIINRFIKNYIVFNDSGYEILSDVYKFFCAKNKVMYNNSISGIGFTQWKFTRHFNKNNRFIIKAKVINGYAERVVIGICLKK